MTDRAKTKRPPARRVPHVLATDLDGTLIPLEGSRQNRADLETLAAQLIRHRVTLVFVTGRHLASVAGAISEFQLPDPDWVICDVGTSIYQRGAGGSFRLVADYVEYQEQIIAPMPLAALRQRLERLAGLRLQEQEKQGRFKLSFYAEAAGLEQLVDRIHQVLEHAAAPYSVIHSIDPFNGCGLVDLLPRSVSKAHALAWWVEHARLNPEGIVFAGDSGNDWAAITAGYRAIVVGNADRELARRADEAHRRSGWTDRLYLARRTATSGVLEGCHWFGLADPPTAR